MFSVNYIFLLNITYIFANITCLGFLVLTHRAKIRESKDITTLIHPAAPPKFHNLDIFLYLDNGIKAPCIECPYTLYRVVINYN